MEGVSVVELLCKRKSLGSSLSGFRTQQKQEGDTSLTLWGHSLLWGLDEIYVPLQSEKGQCTFLI